MSNEKAKGTFGEALAADFLEKEGYTILKKNYLKNGGELDIVAFKNGAVVFIEVKTRYSYLMGEPAAAVDTFKQLKIIKGAEGFMSENEKLHSCSFRFDVIEVMPKESKRINHIINAFEVEE